jgi:hypothetical protein
MSVTAFYSSIGIARSADDAKRGRAGPVINGREAYPPPNIRLRAGNQSAIVTDGYIYVFYIDNVGRAGQFGGTACASSGRRSQQSAVLAPGLLP